MIYYIADIHFDDLLVFKKCHREYSIEQYRELIIDNWNSRVNDDDDVYILGDVAEDNFTGVIDILRKLKGKKYLIVGNHDEKLEKLYEESRLFLDISFIKLIIDNGRKVCLCHYPLMDWMEFNREGILVYGHIHNKTALNGPAYAQMKEYYKDKPAYNAGVDVIGFKPRTLDELITIKEKNKDAPYIN